MARRKIAPVVPEIADRAAFNEWVRNTFGSTAKYQSYICQATIEGTSLKTISETYSVSLVMLYVSISGAPEFKKRYEAALQGRLFLLNNEAINFGGLKTVPTVVDKYGNQDLARGYLDRAKSEHQITMQVLERKTNDWKTKTESEVKTDAKLGIVVMPPKETEAPVG